MIGLGLSETGLLLLDVLLVLLLGSLGILLDVGLLILLLFVCHWDHLRVH